MEVVVAMRVEVIKRASRIRRWGVQERIGSGGGQERSIRWRTLVDRRCLHRWAQIAGIRV